MKIGDMVTLVGKSRHGKNRIKEHGDRWTILQIKNNVACCNGGKGFMLGNNDGDVRWVADKDDPDFEIVE